MEYKGLSTDPKPFDAREGDIFQELNTDSTFIFKNGKWTSDPSYGSGGGTSDIKIDGSNLTLGEVSSIAIGSSQVASYNELSYDVNVGGKETATGSTSYITSTVVKLGDLNDLDFSGTDDDHYRELNTPINVSMTVEYNGSTETHEYEVKGISISTSGEFAENVLYTFEGNGPEIYAYEGVPYDAQGIPRRPGIWAVCKRVNSRGVLYEVKKLSLTQKNEIVTSVIDEKYIPAMKDVERRSNKVTDLNGYFSSDEQYPSAKATAAAIGEVKIRAQKSIGFETVPARVTELTNIGVDPTTNIPNYRAMAYGNGKFVAIAIYSSQAVYSEDGINWTVVDLPFRPSCICYGSLGFVIADGSSRSVALSADGIHWKASTMPSGNGVSYLAFGEANGKPVYIAMASTAASNYYSNDGITWNSISTSLYGSKSGLVYQSGEFFVIIGPNTLYRSSDGITWTKSGSLPSRRSWSALASNGSNMLVAIDYGTNYYATSSDGSTWALRSTPQMYSTFSDYIFYCNDRFFVELSDHSIFYTDNTLEPGKISRIDSESEIIKSMVYAGSNYVALSGGKVYRSSDLSTWASVDLPTFSVFSDVAFGNGKFVALMDKGSGIGDGGTDNNKVLYSSDGATWAWATLPESVLDNFLHKYAFMSFVNDRFVAFTNNSPIGAYSFDGATWTKFETPSALNIDKIVYGDGKFIFADVGNISGSLVCTTDFVNWDEFELPEGKTFTDIECGKDLIILAGDTWMSKYLNNQWVTLSSATACADALKESGESVSYIKYIPSEGFIAFNTGVMSSRDGYRWGAIDRTTNSIYKMFDVGSGVLSIESYVGARAYISTIDYVNDGVEWVEMNNYPISNLSGIAFNDNMIVGVSNSSKLSGTNIYRIEFAGELIANDMIVTKDVANAIAPYIQ